MFQKLYKMYVEKIKSIDENIMLEIIRRIILSFSALLIYSILCIIVNSNIYLWYVGGASLMCILFIYIFEKL
jgi:hypothetical protein